MTKSHAETVQDEMQNDLDPFAEATNGQTKQVAEGDAPVEEVKEDRGDDFDPMEEIAAAQTPEETTEEEPVAEVAEDTVETKKEEEEVHAEAKPQTIPKQRFDEINERRKLAEERLAEIEARQQQQQQSTATAENKTTDPAPEAFDFQAKEDEYMDAVLDGRKEDALSIRNEIRAAERAEFERTATEAAQQSTTQAREVAKLQVEIDKLQETYDFLNDSSPTYDTEITQEILDLYESQVLKGYDMATAMQRASRYVLKAHDKLDIPAVDPEPEPVINENAVEIAKRSQKVKSDKARAAVEKSAPSIASAGSSSSEAGLASSANDISRMTDEEFAALPGSKLAELRGDVVGS